MKTSHRIWLAIAALGLSGLAASSAQASIIFDDFNSGVGHFGSQPSGSGTTNFAASSTATLNNTDSVDNGGTGSMQLNLVKGATTPARVRFISGLGTPANNVVFTTTQGVNQFIGFYYKTSDPSAVGMTASISLDDSTNTAAGDDGGVQKTLTVDGQWHLVEWNTGATTANTDWGAVTGVGGGHSGLLPNGTHTIDSVLFYNDSFPAGATTTVIEFDFVALNDAGHVSALGPVQTPEPGSMALVLVGGLIMARRRRR